MSSGNAVGLAVLAFMAALPLLVIWSNWPDRSRYFRRSDLPLLLGFSALMLAGAAYIVLS